MRNWYINATSLIKDNIDYFLPIEEKAQQAFNERNRIRIMAREMMADIKTKNKLYREKPQKTFEQLIDAKKKKKGLSREEAIKDIFETAIKTNEDVNKIFGIGGE